MRVRGLVQVQIRVLEQEPVRMWVLERVQEQNRVLNCKEYSRAQSGTKCCNSNW
jgi:hypothetical protein